MPDLNQFITWAGENYSRRVTIEIGNGETKIWVWDSEIMEGQYVNGTEEIDLKARYRERLKKQFAEAKAVLGEEVV